jgi:hypothetical protein
MKILALPLLVWSLAAPAQDLERGRLLYQTHCATCHTERLHHRDKSKIRSFADLRDEVARWAPQTKHRFTLDDIEDVVQFLNASHYRIGEASQAPELIFGAELMSAQERGRYRREIGGAKSEEAATRLRERHRNRMRERARERGVRLAEPGGIVAK